MKVQLRFLKQDLIHFELEEDTTVEEMKRWGKEYIGTLSDQDLLFAMLDCIPSKSNLTRFDFDSFQIDAIENEEFNLLYSTPLWDTYLGKN